MEKLAIQFSDVVVSLAAEDTYLRAYMQLRRYGETDVVEPKVADFVSTLCDEEIYEDLQVRYGLTDRDVIAATARCAKDTIRPGDQDYEWSVNHG